MSGCAVAPVLLPALLCDTQPDMKAILYAQFNPAKTLRASLHDRNVFRAMIIGALLCSLCL